MQHKDIDWKELRGAIIVLVICLSVGITILYASIYFQERMQREFSRNDARFRSISQRYLAVDEEEKLINEYYPKFIELFKNGIIGKEQRLNWIEVLRTATRELNLPRLSYQIESQKPYTPGYTINPGKFKVFSSNMKLEMSLLHEGDLFNIFSELDNEAKGLYSPTMCTLSSTGEITEQRDASNIKASCELQWYTIKLADGTELKI